MTNPDYTHIALVLDRSGSMSTIADDMNGGIYELMQEQAKLPGKALVDVTTFDTDVEFPLSNVAPADIPKALIHPRGGTALLDALGRSIARLGEKLESFSEDYRPGHVLVVVVTDGFENASREWTGPSVKAAVEKQKTEYQWDFVFLGANIDSFSVGGGLGFSTASTMNYAASANGTASMLRSASSYITTTRSGLVASFSDEDREEATKVSN